MSRILTLMILLILAAPARAADGILEISQTCAVQTGCFAGDTAGYPVTIIGDAGRSYRLTSDLVLPDENVVGILVSGDDVGVDLSDFAILGPVTCAGTPLLCTPNAGSGVGVAAGTTARGVSVKNGSITGMGYVGVALGEQAEISNLRVRWSRFIGVFVEAGSTVSNSSVYQNGGVGILARSGSIVSGNTAFGNAGRGIVATEGVTVVGNSAYQNQSSGIYSDSGTAISRNSTHQNGGYGIHVTLGGSAVIGNVATGNESTGISAFKSLVQGNAVQANGGFGLDLQNESSYRENLIGGNAGGTVAGGVNAGGNVCNGVVTCP